MIRVLFFNKAERERGGGERETYGFSYGYPQKFVMATNNFYKNGLAITNFWR